MGYGGYPKDNKADNYSRDDEAYMYCADLYPILLEL